MDRFTTIFNRNTYRHRHTLIVENRPTSMNLAGDCLYGLHLCVCHGKSINEDFIISFIAQQVCFFHWVKRMMVCESERERERHILLII